MTTIGFHPWTHGDPTFMTKWKASPRQPEQNCGHGEANENVLNRNGFKWDENMWAEWERKFFMIPIPTNVEIKV